MSNEMPTTPAFNSLPLESFERNALGFIIGRLLGEGTAPEVVAAALLELVQFIGALQAAPAADDAARAFAAALLEFIPNPEPNS